MPLHIFEDTDTLSYAVADWMVDYIASTLEKKGRFTLALSGGSTPRKLHGVLKDPVYAKKIDWPNVHIFWGDERAVPFGDERNNAKMAYDTLLNYVPVLSHHIHIMRTDIPPDSAAMEYDKLLHRYFDLTQTSFDLVLLGMGEDGHTLSLFPGSGIIHEKQDWVKSFFLETQDMYRISLTTPIVNRSAAVAFLVAGQDKAGTLKQVLEGDFRPENYPSQLIRPENGELHWFADQAAASELDGAGYRNA
ncbi:MAG: 6-phosphogluconolactonase [Chitinophagaceae bacterium]